MATLVSPGVSVTVTDESFFIPVSAPTVPLFFIATQDEKEQPQVDTNTVLPALGTFESDVIRTVTSLQQSVELYGVPSFLESQAGLQHHGDARNEYGLFALNQYLGLGNRAYVIRANVNLNDDIDDLRTSWDGKMFNASIVLQNLIQDSINEANALLAAGSPPLPPTVTTVTDAELRSLALTATTELFKSFSFISTEVDFFGAVGIDSALPIYPSGYDSPAVGTYGGFNFDSISDGTPPGNYTPADGASFLLNEADEFKLTLEFFTGTSLGANDQARRDAITTELISAVNSNFDIRAETYDYNLILCPGYPEVTSSLLGLVTTMQDEAMVISDSPMDKNVNETTTWAGTTEMLKGTHAAYYYPSVLASNLDGVNVAVSAAGTALRTYTFNDNVAFLWFAPAGIRRGKITGITNLGYVGKNLGGPNEFTPLALNPGDRDALYQYSALAGAINPLVFFPAQGFVVWGQKMSTGTASALDRVNVARLIAYIKRQLRNNTLSFVFEPNDTLTRDNLKAVVDNFLGDILVKRGLYDFVTICDESNNTPDRIDRNEMYIDVALKPVKAAEFIYIPIRVVATGASI